MCLLFTLRNAVYDNVCTQRTYPLSNLHITSQLLQRSICFAWIAVTIAVSVVHVYFQSGFDPRKVSVMNSVTAKIRHVFEKHGAVHVSTPSLLPKTDLYSSADHCACVLDHNGRVVLLPHDQRVREVLISIVH